MTGHPSRAEQAFATFLGMANLVLCGYSCLFAVYFPICIPMVVVSGLSTVALFCRAVGTSMWSPVMWVGALPGGLLIGCYVVL